MSRLRVYELAKEVGVENRDVVQEASHAGIVVDGHLTMLSAEEVVRLRKVFAKPRGGDVVQKRVRPTVIRRRRTQVSAVKEAEAPQAGDSSAESPVDAATAEPVVAEAELAAEGAEPATAAEAEATEVLEAEVGDAVADTPSEEAEAKAETEEVVPTIDPDARPTATQAVVVAAPKPGFQPPVRPTPSRPPRPGRGPAGPGTAAVARTDGPPTMPPAEGRGERGDAGARKDQDRARPKRRHGRRIVDQHMENWNARMALDDDFGRRGRRGGRRSGRKAKAKKTEITMPKAIKRIVKMEEMISVAELAQQMSIKANELIRKLMEDGVMATLNHMLDQDTTTLIAEEFGFTVENTAFEVTDYVPDVDDTDEEMVSRWPVITIMGHVDHGKTSLLDYIRKENVAEGEAGGITQRISSYEVEREDGTLVFLDTPGHEAFTEMRARGAAVTDLVVLVVAADDGVMPQTVEAINHSKAADVPILVAVNKIDKENAAPERVLQQLAEHELNPEEWGGETVVVQVSAHTGEGIDKLLEMLQLQAELLELKANPAKPARGVVIEATLDKGRGVVSTLLVEEGTVTVGDYVVSGSTYGRVRAITNYAGKKLDAAGPSTPIELLGLSDVPEASDPFFIVNDEKSARAMVSHRQATERKKQMGQTSRMSLEGLFEKMQAGEVADFNIILKCDVQGSIEALKKALLDIEHPEVQVKIIHGASGGITESDVNLATASNAVILGFNVRAESNARTLAEKEKVEIKLYDVIYDAINDVKRAMEGLLTPSIEEKEMGRVEVREVFTIPKAGTIAGSSVQSGCVRRNAMARLFRDNVLVWSGKIGSLRRFKDDVREVKDGYECGIGLENYNDIKVGDLIECFEQVEVAKTID